jgi:hypothetical protein
MLLSKFPKRDDADARVKPYNVSMVVTAKEESWVEIPPETTILMVFESKAAIAFTSWAWNLL